jgi:hypothetical protein
MGDANFTSQSIVAMDSWLAAIEKDKRDLPLARKVIQDKPTALTDRCTDGAGVDADPATCDATVQAYSTPRIEAGMPLADDTLKCDLQPLERSRYAPVTLTDDQWAKLKQTYPKGVCDYSKPGPGRTPTVPWLSYEDGAGGKPLGAAPRSQGCVDRRKFSFAIHQPKRGRVVSVVAYVNGKRVKRVRGRRVTRMTLKKLPQGRFTVRIVATTSRGSRTVSTRRYSGCKKGKPRTRHGR